MEVAIARLMKVMPFLFGIGFVAPCIAQIITRLGLMPPGSISPVAFGLLVGGGWGMLTNIRGRWI